MKSWKDSIGARGIVVKTADTVHVYFEQNSCYEKTSEYHEGNIKNGRPARINFRNLVKEEDMACTICGKNGHNAKTCTQKGGGVINVGDRVEWIGGVPAHPWRGAKGVVRNIKGDYVVEVDLEKGTSTGSDAHLENYNGFATLNIKDLKNIGSGLLTGVLSEKGKELTVWDLVEEVFGKVRLVLLYGPPGTGKTTAGNFLAVESPDDVLNITLTEETPSAELRGHFIPKGGEFIWKDGPALTAFREGRRLVLNEIDKASGDALQFCHGLLDDPGMAKMTLPTGETVYPHEGFNVVATMNGDPMDLPDALRDRFTVRFNIMTPHPDAIASLPSDLRKAAAKGISLDHERSVSMRGWKVFAELREKVGEGIAARAVFGDRAETILNSVKIGGLRDS